MLLAFFFFFNFSSLFWLFPFLIFPLSFLSSFLFSHFNLTFPRRHLSNLSFMFTFYILYSCVRERERERERQRWRQPKDSFSILTSLVWFLKDTFTYLNLIFHEFTSIYTLTKPGNRKQNLIRKKNLEQCCYIYKKFNSIGESKRKKKYEE